MLKNFWLPSKVGGLTLEGESTRLDTGRLYPEPLATEGNRGRPGQNSSRTKQPETVIQLAVQLRGNKISEALGAIQSTSMVDDVWISEWGRRSLGIGI